MITSGVLFSFSFENRSDASQVLILSLLPVEDAGSNPLPKYVSGSLRADSTAKLSCGPPPDAEVLTVHKDEV